MNDLCKCKVPQPKTHLTELDEPYDVCQACGKDVDN